MDELQPGDRDVLRDRQALEQIVGHPLSDEPWPEEALQPGTRVRIVPAPGWDGPWVGELYGVVDRTAAPAPIQNPKAEPGELAYFVTFDEPELRSSGEGPYRKAQIWSRYLRPAPTD